jgi:hypothetical protein
MTEDNEFTDFQIVWCAIMFIALATIYMDVFKWRPDPPEICTRTYHLSKGG